MGITEEQARVYQIIVDMCLKVLLTLAALVLMFLVLHAMLTAEEWRIKTVYGLVEVTLTGTVLRVYKYYFPLRQRKRQKMEID